MSKQNTLNSLRNLTFKSVNTTVRNATTYGGDHYKGMDFFLPLEPGYMGRTQQSSIEKKDNNEDKEDPPYRSIKIKQKN